MNEEEKEIKPGDEELKWRKDISEALARLASSQERIAWILENIEKRIV